MPYETRIMELLVGPGGEPAHSEMATTIRITDEGSGEFVEVEQHGGPGIGKISIARDEWPALRDAIERMIRDCRGEAQ